jgi:hypothetical protein
MRLIHTGLSLWAVLACLTGLELVFALFVDCSDTFNMTNVCQRWFARHVDAHRNFEGFRDSQEITKALQPGQKRICFFGDSFAMGQGIPRMADRFSDRIRDELERKSPGRFRVANLGKAGWDTSLIAGLIDATLVSGYSVDTIVYVYTLNDIDRYDQRTIDALQELQTLQPKSWLWADTYFFNWIYFRCVQLTSSAGRDYERFLKEAYVTASWDGLRNKLNQMHRCCLRHNVELRVVIFPDVRSVGPGYQFREAHRVLLDYFRNAGIKSLDLEPILAKHADERLDVSRFDAHPNERANELAADAIRDYLLDDYFADEPVNGKSCGNVDQPELDSQ